MKKTAILILVFTLCLTFLASCNSAQDPGENENQVPNGTIISIDDFEKEFEITVTSESVSNGMEFTCEAEDVKYSGKTDKAGNIIEFSIVNIGINCTTLNDYDKMCKVISDPGKFTMADFSDNIPNVCMGLISACSLLTEGNNTIDYDEYSKTLAKIISQGEKFIEDGWTVTVTLSESNSTATINAKIDG